MTRGIVTEQQSKALNDMLADLEVQTEANAVYLTDQGGNILACASSAGDDTIQTVAALAAGSFAATRQLASMIGEPSFTSVFHKGERANIYIQCLDEDYLLLVIFGRAATLGLVKLYTDNTCRELLPIFRQMREQGMQSGGVNGKFEFSDDSKAFTRNA